MVADDPPDPQRTDRELIDDALDLLRALDDARPDQMTPLFYMSGFNALYIALREVLRVMGEDVPD